VGGFNCLSAPSGGRISMLPFRLEAKRQRWSVPGAKQIIAVCQPRCISHLQSADPVKMSQIRVAG